MRRKLLVVLIIFLTGILYLNLIPNAVADQKNEITIGFSAMAPSLDTQVQFAMPSYSMCRFIGDPLVYFDWNMEIKPWLVEKWEKVDDTTWKLHLKKGVKFHNGEVFDAQAVKYSMERYLDPNLKTPQKKLYQFTKEVQIVDDYTVIVKTDGPTRPFLNLWAVQNVVPPKAGQDFEQYALNPVGSGPYKVVKYIPNNKVVVEANKDYWGPKPKFAKITFRLLREGSTRVAALLAGEVDLIENVPFDSIEKIEKNPNTTVKFIPSFRAVYLALNQKKFEPFKDKRVRKAIYYGVDREALCKYTFGGMAKVVGAPIGKGVAYHNADLPQYPYDPKKAKELLAEAGYSKGFKVTLGTPNGRYLKDVEVATAIAGQLQKIGIQVTVATTDWGVYRAERGKGKESKFDLWLGAWGNIIADADWAMRWINHSPTLHGYDNSKVDELLDKGRAALDDAVANKIYGELQAIVWEEAPVAYLYWQPSIYGVAKAIADYFEPKPEEYTIFRNRYGD